MATASPHCLDSTARVAATFTSAEPYNVAKTLGS